MATFSRKLLFFSSIVWRKIYVYKKKSYFKSGEKFMYERSSTVPLTFVDTKIYVYTGKKWVRRVATDWLVGFKFGEFTWNRRIAMYKAKQLRKKKLKLAKKNKK